VEHNFIKKHSHTYSENERGRESFCSIYISI